MSVNRTSLGKRISFYRSKSNLTQEALAAKVNCSREYMEEYSILWTEVQQAKSQSIRLARTICLYF